MSEGLRDNQEKVLRVTTGLVVLSDAKLNPGPINNPDVDGSREGYGFLKWFGSHQQWGFYKYQLTWLPEHHFGPGYSLGACHVVKVFGKPNVGKVAV